MFVDLFHLLHKDFPVFGHLDGRHGCPQNLNFVLLQDAQLGELHTAVQRRLTAEGQQHAVWTFIFDHLRAKNNMEH